MKYKDMKLVLFLRSHGHRIVVVIFYYNFNYTNTIILLQSKKEIF